MNSHKFNKLVFLSLVSLVILLTESCYGTVQNKKNVLFIIVDDMRPEIQAWNKSHMQTPNIDKLVHKAISFTRAFCQYANCAPSRKSFLTGLSPETTGHRGHFNSYYAVMNHMSMPGYFRKNGYFTASVGKVYHHARDDRHSWDFYFDVGDPEHPEEVPWECYGLEENQQITLNKLRPAVEQADLPLENYNDYQLCQIALEQLEKNKDEKFFVTVGFRKPHLPFAAPKKYWDHYNRDDLPSTNFRDAPAYGDTIVYQWSELASYDWYSENYVTENYRNKYVSVERSKELRHGYYACVSYIDELVGLFMKKLTDLGIADKTIIVLIGDHGYHLGEQQIWGKHSSYNLSTNVPLIIYDPQLTRDEMICTKFVELMDLYPTLTELCGLPEPKRIDGESLVPLFANDGAEGFDAAFSQYQSFQDDASIKDLMAYAIHTEEYNYIEWQDLKNDRKVVQRELYDVRDNRVERENISTQSEKEEIMQELALRIEKHFNPFRRRYNEYVERKSKTN